MLFRLWKSYVAPMLRRPAGFQVAALCHRHGPGGIEVLMITSRETQRWILPKGWPMYGTDGGGTALQEAWEEAGVKPRGGKPLKICSYRYDKVLDGGLPLPTDVDVYAIAVEKLYDSFPEAGQRTRRWMSPEAAAAIVAEPQLAALLRALPDLPDGAPSP
ncbi:NUDIX hydrolase [Salipiger aestuarii]|nr:NUDIX hydrolase [Salipiger aestuarii]